jgi:tRNA pseudouridine65 synthase
MLKLPNRLNNRFHDPELQIFTEEPTIVYQDEELLVLMKPTHLYVHPPEDRIARKTVGRKNCLHWLWDKHNIKGYPIHRIDFATEGLVLFGKNHQAASLLNKLMKAQMIEKEYHLVVRGWFKEPHGTIQLPLELDSTKELVHSVTHYQTLHQIELPYSVNPNFLTARYSWLHAKLETGRWHQIRRHMNRTAHPIVGDRDHGDSHHNRFFRDQLGINGLCLKAIKLKFPHPTENKMIELVAPDSTLWNKINLLFQPL